jgi:hypothetical protein
MFGSDFRFGFDLAVKFCRHYFLPLVWRETTKREVKKLKNKKQIAQKG